MSLRSTTTRSGFAALAFIAVAAAGVVGQQPAATQQSAADPLNLGFERAGLITATSPARWYAGGQGYVVALDDVGPQSGARSLRMQATAARTQSSFGVATMNLSGAVIAGKTVTLRGYIRTEGITQGYAGLWMRIDSGAKMLVIDNMSARGVTGTTTWAPYEITLRADAFATGCISAPFTLATGLHGSTHSHSRSTESPMPGSPLPRGALPVRKRSGCATTPSPSRHPIRTRRSTISDPSVTSSAPRESSSLERERTARASSFR